MKKLLYTVLILVLVLAAGIGFLPHSEEDLPDSGTPASGSAEESAQEPAETVVEIPSGEAAVHFIDVGQGDCTLIDVGEVEVLVDCGDRDHSAFVLDYLSGIVDGELDYLVATHPDSDHIGGIANVLRTFPVGTVIDSGAEKDTYSFLNYKEEVAKHPEILFIEDSDTAFKLGTGAWLRIIETGDGHEDVNDDSVVCLFRYGEILVLLTGDMGIGTEEENLSKFPEVDVLKAGHHGSAWSTGRDFLKKTKPKYVILSAGKDNDYGHPSEYTLQRIAEIGAEPYITIDKGTIILKTDGKNIDFEFAGPTRAAIPSEETGAVSEVAEEAAAAVSAGETPSEAPYIGNANSLKFHHSWCSSVEDMAEHNKVPFDSREDAINAGYRPCQRCDP